MIPQEQARLILEESEARIAAGAAQSEDGPASGTRLCGATLMGGDGTKGACTLVEGHPGGHMGVSVALTPEA